jgi:hypothetical protein
MMADGWEHGVQTVIFPSPVVNTSTSFLAIYLISLYKESCAYDIVTNMIIR